MPNNNSYVNAVVLVDAGGICCEASRAKVLSVCIKTALTGSLTVTGITNLDGTPAAWVIPSTTVGVVLPPGNSGGVSTVVSFAYSNPGADTGKATLVYSSV